MSTLFLSLVLISVAQHAAAIGPGEPGPSGAPLPTQSDPGNTDAMDNVLALQARFSEGGAFGGEDYKKALIADAQRQAAKYAAQLGPNPPKGFPQWRSLGPTGAKYATNGVTLQVSDSGRVRRVLQDPNDRDTVYVLSAGGGLWKTTTFTHTNPRWVPLTDTLFATSGGSVAFGRDARTIYLGIGDPFVAAAQGMPVIAGVMVKSTDGGATWSSFQTLAGSNNVRDVAVDTSTSADTVLVAADQGLYRSTDAGQTYALVLAPPGASFLGGFWSLVRTSAGWLVTSGTGVVYCSTDRGATWTQVAAFAGAGRITLGVGAAGDKVVYAFAGDEFGFQTFDLLRSTDGGFSWTALGVNTGRTPTNPNVDQPDLNLMGGQAFYNQMVLVDPADASRQTVYLGGQLSTAKSTDGGASWTLISDWLPGGDGPSTAGLPYVHADVHTASIINLRNQAGIVFGTDGGLSVSADGGATFDSSKNDGLVTMLAQTVMGSTKNPQDLISGTQDLGTRARLGASGVFNQVTGGDGQGVGWSQANNAFTLASAEFGYIVRSNGLLPNTRGNWQFVGPGLGFGADFFLFYTAIGTPSAVTDNTGGYFFTTTGRTVFFTGDGGRRWFICARARSGARLPPTFLIRDTQHEIGLDATANFNNVAVGGYAGKIAFTRDGCPTWTVVNLINAVPGFQGYISSPAWTSQGALYVASESPLIRSVRVVKSLDNGLSWVRADFGLPDSPVYHIVIDPRDPAGNTLYAATGIGVFRTTDGGASWSMFGAGLPAVTSMGLWIAPDGSSLRVATFGRGIWEINP